MNVHENLTYRSKNNISVSNRSSQHLKNRFAHKQNKHVHGIEAAFSIDSWQKSGQGVAAAPTATPLGMALVGVRVDQVAEENLARPKSGYLLGFEIVSVHLLVVLVGAAYLARAKRRRVPRPVDLVASADSVKTESPVGASPTLVAGGSK